MTVRIDGAVSVAAIAEATGLSVDEIEAEARSLAIFVGRDWAGRDAVSEDDADGLVSGALRRDQDHAAAWHAHLGAVETWESEREKVREAAAVEAYKVEFARGSGGPRASEVAREVGRAARDRWERSHPAPVLPSAGPAKSWLQKIGVGR